MKILNLTVENFMSYQGTHSFNLAEGLTIIEGRNTDTLKVSSNGAGKSSILYAICWALYGKVPPGGLKNSIINHGSSGAKVQLDLVGEYQLRILRQKEADGSEQLEFWVGHEHVKKDQAAQTQKQLEVYYGISWDVFCNTVYLGASSGTVRFVQATASQRAGILADFVDDGIFQEAAGRVGEEIKRLGELESQHRGAIQSISVAIDATLLDVERYNTAITMEELAMAERQSLMRQQVDKKEEELLRLTSFCRSSPSRSAQEAQAEFNAVQQAYHESFQRAVTLKTLSGLAIHSVGQKCPTCSQAVTAATVQQQTVERQQAWDELQKVLKQQQAYQASMQALQNELQGIAGHATQVQMAQARIEAIHQEIAAMRGQAESQALSFLHREREIAQQRIVQLRQDQNEYQVKVGTIHQRMPHLKVLQAGFSKEIRSMLLDDLRNLLAYYAEEYRYVLAGNEISIDFPQSELKGRNEFEIVIKTGNTANPLTSGGETDRASFAITLALRKALLYSKACPFHFLLVDDPIGKLDEPGALDFFQLLDHLTADYSNVLVTVPRTIEVAVPHRKIVVTRQDRISQAQEVA